MSLKLDFGKPGVAVDPELRLGRMLAFREAFEVLRGDRKTATDATALGFLKEVDRKGLDDEDRRLYAAACEESIAALERRIAAGQ